jgi:hypothetical protein
MPWTSAARGCVALLACVAWGCGADGAASNPVGPTSINGPFVLVGAGDIAECGVAGAAMTALLLDDIQGIVFAAGDNAYYQGSLDQYERCYTPAWGRHKRRTRPIPGNHEYETAGASGYFSYFGDAASPSNGGYYSYDAGPWHVVALNSEIPMDGASPQHTWLRADLAAHPASCTLAYLHRPLFSSGINGPQPDVRPLWTTLYNAGVDVVISGHDHIYERFAPQHPTGRVDLGRGIRQFVVGTGGSQLTAIATVRPNSEIRASAWGVLKLTLREGQYAWEFVPVAGESFRDLGIGTCH